MLATAIRETQEEIGLDLATTATTVARLDDIPALRSTTSGLVITPFVFVHHGHDPTFEPNAEVAPVLWADVAPLMRGERATSLAYRFGTIDVDLPGYEVGGHVVWGLTYQVLEPLLRRVNALMPRGADG
jgi:8-oxo-dGTP pyrophosphatase MutT (NUDIX family)